MNEAISDAIKKNIILCFWKFVLYILTRHHFNRETFCYSPKAHVNQWHDTVIFNTYYKNEPEKLDTTLSLSNPRTAEMSPIKATKARMNSMTANVRIAPRPTAPAAPGAVAPSRLRHLLCRPPSRGARWARRCSYVSRYSHGAGRGLYKWINYANEPCRVCHPPPADDGRTMQIELCPGNYSLSLSVGRSLLLLRCCCLCMRTSFGEAPRELLHPVLAWRV